MSHSTPKSGAKAPKPKTGEKVRIEVHQGEDDRELSGAGLRSGRPYRHGAYMRDDGNEITEEDSTNEEESGESEGEYEDASENGDDDILFTLPKHSRQGKLDPVSEALVQLTQLATRQDRRQAEMEKAMTASSRGGQLNMTFDGEGDFLDFLAAFKQAASLRDWNQGDWGKQLFTRLKGEALSTVASLTDPSFDNQVEALSAEFGPKTAESCRMQLKTREQKKGETIPQFAHAIKKLVRRAYPEAQGSTFDHLALSTFIEGQTDPQVRNPLRAANPTTIDAALKMATLLSDGREAEKTRARRVSPTEDVAAEAHVLPQPAATDAVVVELKAQVDNLAQVVRQMKDKPQSYEKSGHKGRNYDKGKGPKCWACNKFGHIRVNCPTQQGPTRAAEVYQAV